MSIPSRKCVRLWKDWSKIFADVNLGLSRGYLRCRYPRGFSGGLRKGDSHHGKLSLLSVDYCSKIVTR